MKIIETETNSAYEEKDTHNNTKLSVLHIYANN